MVKRALLLLLPIFVIGCGAKHSDESQSLNFGGHGDQPASSPPIAQSAPPPPPPVPPSNPSSTPSPEAAPPEPGRDPADGATTPQPAERRIIRNGEITLRVESLDSAERGVAAIASINNGYTSNSSRERSEGNAMTGTLQIRVPADKFQSVLAAVRKLGEVERETIAANDVTEEYVDLNARLKTQQELETRLLALLNERSGKLSDIIEIESKLADVRKEIESIQGRLRFLQGQVSYSTLTVTMIEPGAVGSSRTETFGGRIADAFDSGIDGLIGVMGGLITVVIALIPLAALIAVAYLILRPAWRRRKARRASERNNEKTENV